MTDANNPMPAIAIPECTCCFNKIKPEDQFCPACGFPLKGSAEIQQQFFENRNYQQMEMAGLKEKIKRAGTSLYLLAGIFLLYGLVYFFIGIREESASAILITYAIIAVIFLLLGYLAEKKSLAAIISGMVLYLLVILMDFIQNPFNIARGIIFKVVIISYLIRGLVSAMEAEKIKKQYNI